MEIQIEVPNEQAVKNFAKWFRKEGFDLFTKSKYNKLEPKNTDAYVTCLATDEKMTTHGSDEISGWFIELQ